MNLWFSMFDQGTGISLPIEIFFRVSRFVSWFLMMQYLDGGRKSLDVLIAYKWIIFYFRPTNQSFISSTHIDLHSHKAINAMDYNRLKVD